MHTNINKRISFYSTILRFSGIFASLLFYYLFNIINSKVMKIRQSGNSFFHFNLLHNKIYITSRVIYSFRIDESDADTFTNIGDVY